MDVANLRVLFTAEGERNVTGAIDKVNRGLNSVDGSARKAGSALDSVFKVAGGVLLSNAVANIGRGIVNMAGGLLSAHSNAEQLRVSLDIAVGSASEAADIFGKLQAFAAETPFQFPELIESAVRLESFGLDALDVMGTLGDTAAGMGKSLEQVTAAYLDAGMGQFVRLQELGIDAAVVGEEVVFSWVENGKTIRKAVDKNNQELIRSTVAAIWNDKYAGAMEKQSRTFAGQWSTLKDNAALAMMSMTDGIFGALTEVLDFANQVFSVGFVDALHAIEGPLQGIGDAFAGLIEWTDAFASAFMAAFGSGVGIDQIVEFLPEQFAALEQPILAVADALGDLYAAAQNGNFLAVLGEELGNIASAGIDLGAIAVRFAWGEIVNVGESLWDKIVAYTGLGNVTDGTAGPGATPLPFTTIDVLIAGVVKLSGDLDDIGAAIAEALGLVRTEADLTAARAEGELLGQDIWDSFTGGISDGVGGETGGKATALEDIATRLIEMSNPFLMIKGIYDGNTIFAEWMQFGVGIGEGMLNALMEGLSAAFNGEKSFNLMTGTSVTSGGVAGWLNDTADAIIQEFKNIPGDVAAGVGTLPQINIDPPELPDWLTSDFSWITGPVDAIVNFIGEQIARILRKFGELNSVATGGPPQNMFGDKGGRSGDPNFNYADLGEEGAQFQPELKKFTAELDLDKTAFDVGVEAAKSVGTAFDATTYTGEFDIDNGPAAIKYTEAFGWGNTFAGTTWTGTFDLDIGPAAVAYTTAFGWGNTWASQVFTASFAIDTSALAGARAEALDTAQYIRDVMPNSPAKIGPLSGKVPSLDYIADSFAASFRRMRSDADLAVAGVAGSLGRRGGAAINNPTYHIYPETGDAQRQVTAAVIGDWR